MGFPGLSNTHFLQMAAMESLWASPSLQFLNRDPAVSFENDLSHSSVLVFTFSGQKIHLLYLDPRICPSCCMLLWWAVLMRALLESSLSLSWLCVQLTDHTQPVLCPFQQTTNGFATGFDFICDKPSSSIISGSEEWIG